MLKKLILINCFTHPKLTVDFTKGFNFITGRNGKGKTLILEMISYCLFGMRATRGTADDYKKLLAELTVVIRGTEYTIKRGGNDSVSIGDNVIVNGTSAVNEYLKRIIGYDMEVFNITNYSKQSQTELFTAMLPSARKAMVDKLCGLDQLDTYAKKAADAIKVQNGIIQALASQVANQPVEPVFIGSTKTREEWVEIANAVRGEKSNLARLKLALDQAYGKAPKRDDEAHTKLASLVEFNQCFKEAEVLTGMAEQKRTTAFNAELDKQKAVLSSNVNRNTETIQKMDKITEALLISQEALHDQKAKYARRLELSKSLVPHTCPACAHHWNDAHPDYEKFKDAPAPLSEPTLTKQQIASLRSGLESIPSLRAQIQADEKAYANLQYAAVSAEDFSSILQSFQQEREIRAKLEGYETAQENIRKLSLEFNDCRPLEVLSDELDEAEKEISEYDKYAIELTRFEVQNTTYLKAVEDNAKAKAQIEMLKSVGEAVKNVKQNLKTYLTPSLSTIATRIISEATNGELHTLIVDGDFNITVNSKAVEKLEGSGISLVNVAMRVALGQVLTNGVMSIFLGDELDKALDFERSDNLITALKRISNTINQVIIVTHKPVVEDILVHLK